MTHTHRWSLILCVDSKQCAGQAFGDAGSNEPCRRSVLWECLCTKMSVFTSARLSSDLSGPQRRDSRDLWAQKVGSVSRRRIDVLWCGCIEAGRWPAERPVHVSQPMLHFSRGRWRKRQKDLLENRRNPVCMFLMFQQYTNSQRHCNIKHINLTNTFEQDMDVVK